MVSSALISDKRMWQRYVTGPRQRSPLTHTSIRLLNVCGTRANTKKVPVESELKKIEFSVQQTNSVKVLAVVSTRFLLFEPWTSRKLHPGCHCGGIHGEFVRVYTYRLALKIHCEALNKHLTIVSFSRAIINVSAGFFVAGNVLSSSFLSHWILWNSLSFIFSQKRLCMKSSGAATVTRVPQRLFPYWSETRIVRWTIARGSPPISLRRCDLMSFGWVRDD